jgi:hypothetical protein
MLNNGLVHLCKIGAVDKTIQKVPVPQALLTYAHSIGNGEVDSSILSGSTIFY